MRVALSCLAMMASVGAARAEDARPQRIVSINLCMDELLLRLADRERVASVTWMAGLDRESNVVALARGIPANHSLAEEVLAFRPDLVLASAFTTRASVDILRRTGAKVAEFGVPENMDEVRAQIRAVAAVIGERERGEAMIRDMDARLAALAPLARGPALRAVVLTPNGITVNKGSMVDEMMTRAGLENLAGRLDIGNYLQIPLEAVVLQEADVLILDGESEGPPSLATEALRHPVIAALGRRLQVISMPSKLWTCAGPALVDAVQFLIQRTRRESGAATQ